MIAWSLNKPQSLVYSIPWNNNESAASTFFVKTKSSRSVKMTNNRPTFTIKLKSPISVDFLTKGQNKAKAKVSQIILRKLDEKISSMLLEAIKMTQKMKTDVFQLGMLLEWNYPEYWNQVRHKWDDYYSNELRIKVETQLYIDNFGSEE
jgi:spore germination protein KC